MLSQTHQRKPSDHSRHDDTKNRSCAFVEKQEVHLLQFDRKTLERQALANTPVRYQGGARTLEQICVNYLRHSSSYKRWIRKLKRLNKYLPDRLDRRARRAEGRECVAVFKKRILDEIGEAYPWLKDECDRQKKRTGVENDPGEYEMPFGPFKGKRLCELDVDYIARLLGKPTVKKGLRTRLERHLAERLAANRNPAAEVEKSVPLENAALIADGGFDG